MNYKKEILQLINSWGLTVKKVSEVMEIKPTTFRDKKNDNNKRHSFNQKNYDKLVEHLKKQSEKL